MTCSSRRVAITMICALALSCAAGRAAAAEIKLVNATPGKQKVDGDGTYTLGDNEELISVTFTALNTKTKQVSLIYATAKDGSWNATLTLVAGNYDCQALMEYKKGGKVQPLKESNVKNVDVAN